jgi:hypothetical protein
MYAVKTRIIHTKIWEDDFFVNLSRASKLLFVYLISNSRINLSGFFELPDRVITFDTGLTNKELEDSKKELIPKAVFYKGWVYIKNAQHLGGYKGEKNDKASKNEKSLIPSDIQEYCYRVSKNNDRVFEVSDTSINHKSEIRNQKSEYSENFLKFYELYPRKIGKQKAYQAFKKVDSEFKDIMEGLERHDFTDDPQYIPHPTSWLNGRRWEDEGFNNEPVEVVKKVYKSEAEELADLPF